MFDFFEELIEKLGIKSITDFTDKLYDWIRDIKNNSKGELNDNGGNYAKIGSSGNSAKIGSSGYFAKIGSSGNSTKIGSSGNSAKIGSSGNYTKIGSSGNYAKIGSSGDFAKIGSSGDFAKIGSSGNYTKIGSSGNSTKIGSSGNYAKIGSSGDSTQIDISGDYSVGFACGRNTVIKAKNGTWISLCEYQWNEEKSRYIPIYVSSAQIGNKEYKDFRGRILKETEYYCFFNKKFYPVDLSDGIKIIKISEKKKDGITIIKGQDFNNEEIYVVKEKELSAHGETLKEALEDLNYKKLESEETEKIVQEIKTTGKVTKAQYRAITGACQFGTNKFCEKHNITDEEISLDELRKILIDDYGAKQFWSLIEAD